MIFTISTKRRRLRRVSTRLSIRDQSTINLCLVPFPHPFLAGEQLIERVAPLELNLLNLCAELFNLGSKRQGVPQPRENAHVTTLRIEALCNIKGVCPFDTPNITPARDSGSPPFGGLAPDVLGGDEGGDENLLIASEASFLPAGS